MNSYLTDETISKLQSLYLHETHNMLVYTEISSWLDVNGFKNLAKYYYDWSQEERNHSIWVKEFLGDLNIPLKIMPIEGVNYNLDSDITLFAKATLEVENLTNDLWQEILENANQFEDSAILVQFANKLLLEQIEETGKANNMNDYMKNIGNNRALLQLFDNTFEG